jgi:hypothetical protein
MMAQCGTAAVLFGTGDLIAQQAVEKKGLEGHDVRGLVFLFLFTRGLYTGKLGANYGFWKVGSNGKIDFLWR